MIYITYKTIATPAKDEGNLGRLQVLQEPQVAPHGSVAHDVLPPASRWPACHLGRLSSSNPQGMARPRWGVAKSKSQKPRILESCRTPTYSVFRAWGRSTSVGSRPPQDRPGVHPAQKPLDSLVRRPGLPPPSDEGNGSPESLGSAAGAAVSRSPKRACRNRCIGILLAIGDLLGMRVFSLPFTSMRSPVTSLSQLMSEPELVLLDIRDVGGYH
jgi:hypothetical protein